jgi:hypothetical protein
LTWARDIELIKGPKRHSEGWRFHLNPRPGFGGLVTIGMIALPSSTTACSNKSFLSLSHHARYLHKASQFRSKVKLALWYTLEAELKPQLPEALSTVEMPAEGIVLRLLAFRLVCRPVHHHQANTAHVVVPAFISRFAFFA